MVIPIPKKGDRTLLDTLRPITITHIYIAGKLLEKHVANFIEDCLELNDFTSNSHMRFRVGYSTSDAISELVINLNRHMNHGQYTVCLFLDLKKAFDCVNHLILIKKIIGMGFNTKIVSWIKSFLSNRLQSVKVNGITSDPLNITCGVLQGSVLGPILFKIYINDISSLDLHSGLILYADDAVLFSSHNFVSTAMSTLQTDLDNVCKWTCHNKLTVNINKSKFLIVGTPRMLNRMNGNLSPLPING